MTYSWFSANAPVNLPDGTAIFCINFNLVSPSLGDSYDIDFSNFPTPVQLATQSSLPNFVPSSDFVISNGNIQINLDAENPTINCPSDLTVDTGGAPSTIVNNIAPTANDNCDVPTVTYSLFGATTGSGNTDASGTSFNAGTTLVTYTATDASGNSVDCSFNVTITSTPTSIVTISIDSLMVDCSDNTTQVCVSAESFEDIRGVQFTLTWDPTELQYVDTSNLNLNNALFGVNDVSNGSLTYSWFSNTPVTLADGVSLFCLNFNILSPTPGDSYDVTFANFPTPVQLTTQVSLPNPVPNSNFVISDGNVEVNLDNENPTIDCPDDMTINSNGANSIIVNNIAPMVSDNCGTPDVTYSLTGNTLGSGMTDASGTSFDVGNTLVTYTATDASGNSVDCSFNVMVVQEALSITCPSNVLVPNDAGLCSATVNNLDLTVNSSMANIDTIYYTISGNPIITGTGSTINHTFELGTSIVTFFVKDVFGDSTNCAFNVTVTDSENPTFTSCPLDITCLLYTSPSPRDATLSRMPSSA